MLESMTEYNADRDRKVAAHDDLMKALRAVEWVKRGTCIKCPSCDGCKRTLDGHTDKCQLAEAIAKGEAK